MSHKNGDVTVVTHMSQCHHRDQGLVIPMYMDVIMGDPCDDVCDNCVTFVTQKMRTHVKHFL